MHTVAYGKGTPTSVENFFGEGDCPLEVMARVAGEPDPSNKYCS